MIKLLLIESRDLLESMAIPYCESITLETFDTKEITDKIIGYKKRHDNSEGVFVMALNTDYREQSKVYYSAFVNNMAFRTEANINQILKCDCQTLTKWTVKLNKYGVGSKVKTMSIEKFKNLYESIKNKWRWLIKYQIEFIADENNDDCITFVEHS